MRVRVLGETHGRRVEGVEVLRHLCMCITRLCASIVLRCRCPTGCVPPPTSSTPYVERRLRHVDALLPCANPCARTSACLPRRVLRALLLLREFDSPFYLCAQPVHRHVVSQPCAALWRLGLEQLAALRAPPSTKVCGNCILVCLARPPSPVHSSSGVHRHQAASSTVICAHALPFLYALLRHAALIRHKSCLAMPPRGRIVT